MPGLAMRTFGFRATRTSDILSMSDNPYNPADADSEDEDADPYYSDILPVRHIITRRKGDT